MNATAVERKCQCGVGMSRQTVDVDDGPVTYLAASADDIKRVYEKRGRPAHDILRTYSGSIAFRGACRND